MNKENYIVDEPLPLNQNFAELKEEGLAYIQTIANASWTNLNQSDPGVTILDQICYALTELGYCNDFPVQDILTRANGTLEIADQFYLPEEILTTSPLTANDYRKYIVDGIKEVSNALIFPSDSGVKRVYQTYLFINSNISNTLYDDICTAAFFYLNKARNLGEQFLKPLALKTKVYCIKGRIDIEKESDLSSLFQAMQNEIQNYIFPEIVPEGYAVLQGKGFKTNEIFNGPRLKNGWILNENLGTKSDRLTSSELVSVLASITGVASVSGLGFLNSTDPAEITVDLDELIAIDLIHSVLNKTLEVYCKGIPVKNSSSVKTGSGFSKSRNLNTNTVYSVWTASQTEIPKGKYREIDTYYSIQNTFPEIYGVGPDSVDAHASEFEIAQSRQLKGYLTLFDQVIANQFSQLANIDKLFSFRNTVTGSPTLQKSFYSENSSYDMARSSYPAPFQSFSPTYFYRALYDVPHIKPLLRNFDAFEFGSEMETKKVRNENDWKDYKLDPYNSYIRGLMLLMEKEDLDLSRRNEVLDHLLARHGESPDTINSILNDSVYTYNSAMDKVIVKSLYLQNLGLLSYYRQKAYNYWAASKIAESIEPIPQDYEVRMLGGYSLDFIVRSNKIDQIEKLQEQDFVNFSGLELKLSLLLGLRALFMNFISTVYEKLYNGHEPVLEVIENVNEINASWWLINERRGFIMIETALVLELEFLKRDSSAKVNVQDGGCPDLILIFPDFIPGLKTDDFKRKLELLMEEDLPVEISYKYFYASLSEIALIIPAFATWHNSLIYGSKASEDQKTSQNELYHIIEKFCETKK